MLWYEATAYQGVSPAELSLCTSPAVIAGCWCVYLCAMVLRDVSLPSCNAPMASSHSLCMWISVFTHHNKLWNNNSTAQTAYCSRLNSTGEKPETCLISHYKHHVGLCFNPMWSPKQLCWSKIIQMRETKTWYKWCKSDSLPINCFERSKYKFTIGFTLGCRCYINIDGTWHMSGIV